MYYNIEMDIIAKTCSTECFGSRGYHGSCCRLEERDYIIGPVSDASEVAERLGVSYDDMFIEYSEGSAMYPHLSSWQNPSHYPALRIRGDACVNYNTALRRCTIYSDRPQICRDYVCSYLSKRLSQA